VDDRRDFLGLGFVPVAVLVVGYVLIQLGANLTAIKTVALFGEHPIPAGTLLYALSFTWINMITEYLGKQRARQLVLVSIAANVMMIAWFQLVIGLPGTSEWNADPANQSSIDAILGAVPRIYLASMATAFVVENVDISIFSAVKSRLPRVPLWGRAAISNTFAAPLDGLLFAVLAFGGTLPASFIASMVVTSAIYKLVVSYLSIPLVYALKARRRQPARRAARDAPLTVSEEPAAATASS
jgi:uncharacterized integral membrane protein (TIGR00697 family)